MVSYAFNVSAPAPYLSEGRCGDGLCLDSAAKIIISSEYRPDPSVFFKERRSFHRCTRPASCKSGSSVKCIDRNFKQLSASPPLLPVLLFSLRIGDAPLSLPPYPPCLCVRQFPVHRPTYTEPQIPDRPGTPFPTAWERHSQPSGNRIPDTWERPSPPRIASRTGKGREYMKHFHGKKNRTRQWVQIIFRNFACGFP